MAVSRWRRRPRHPLLPPALRAWLTVPDSLTTRLQRLGREFRVEVIRETRERSLHPDVFPERPRVCVREVVLRVDGEPLVFAHTEVSTVPRGVIHRWLARLGTRSLGSLLFAHPGFCRSPIAFCPLDARDGLYQRAAAHLPLDATAWARRSAHRWGNQIVLVTEVFSATLAAGGTKRLR